MVSPLFGQIVPKGQSRPNAILRVDLLPHKIVPINKALNAFILLVAMVGCLASAFHAKKRAAPSPP